jgi:hypothetical protein
MSKARCREVVLVLELGNGGVLVSFLRSFGCVKQCSLDYVVGFCVATETDS